MSLSGQHGFGGKWVFLPLEWRGIEAVKIKKFYPFGVIDYKMEVLY